MSFHNNALLKTLFEENRLFSKFLKLKSKLLNFGRNSSLEDISRNTLNRFSVCEIQKFLQKGFYFSKTSFKTILQRHLGLSKGEVLEINSGLYTFPNGIFGKRRFEITGTWSLESF
jgi:hypothetical protein